MQGRIIAIDRTPRITLANDAQQSKRKLEPMWQVAVNICHCRERDKASGCKRYNHGPGHRVVVVHGTSAIPLQQSSIGARHMRDQFLTFPDLELLEGNCSLKGHERLPQHADVGEQEDNHEDNHDVICFPEVLSCRALSQPRHPGPRTGRSAMSARSTRRTAPRLPTQLPHLLSFGGALPRHWYRYASRFKAATEMKLSPLRSKTAHAACGKKHRLIHLF